MTNGNHEIRIVRVRIVWHGANKPAQGFPYLNVIIEHINKLTIMTKHFKTDITLLLILKYIFC